MKRYLNKSGTSPITHFYIEPDRISVWYKDTSQPYIYPEYKTGKAKFESLKLRATAGFGLSTYINKHVKQLYI